MIDYLTHIAIIICIYIVLAVSLDLALGFTGLINMGHIAFFGIGAYASALLVMIGWNYLVAIIIGGGVAAFTGYLLALPTTKLKGDYLAVATLGFHFIVENVMKNWTSLTRGPLGIPGIPKPNLFGWQVTGNYQYLLFSFIIMVVCVLLMRKLLESSFGRNLEAVRDDEIAAATLGKNVFKLKSTALAASAFFAGIAGSLYAHYITFIDPNSFSILEIVLLFSIVIVGGLGSVKGAILGTIILIIIPEPLRFIGLPSSLVGPARQMLYALILILILYYKPRGLFGRVDLGND